MIVSFGNQLARDLVENKKTKEIRKFSNELIKVARRKLNLVHVAKEVKDLRIPPGNRLEALKGNLKGFFSIRINDQWRVVFEFKNGNAMNVKVEDYRK